MSAGIVIDNNGDAAECAKLLAQVLADHASGTEGLSAMNSVGGWHTQRFQLGRGWLGEAMLRRLERAGRSGAGMCWGNILPPGAEYAAHVHHGQKLVAVWCLTDSGGALHIGPDVVPDRAGQLVVFPGDRLHWVPKVERERVTVAANLG